MRRLAAGIVTALLAVAGVTSAGTAAAAEERSISAECDALEVALYGYGSPGTVEVTIDDAVTDSQSLESWDGGHEFWGWYPLDWSTAHDWTVTLDSTDDAEDFTVSGISVPCDSDPDVYAHASAWCQGVQVEMAGYPAGTRVVMDVDGARAYDRYLDAEEAESFWYEHPLDGTGAHDWTVVVDAPDDALDRTESGTARSCIEDRLYTEATCEWVAVEGQVTGRLEVVVDGETLEDRELAGWYGQYFYWDWRVAHEWSVTISDGDGSALVTRSGVSEPCDEDPTPPVHVDATCQNIWIDAADQVAFPQGGTVTVVVDGQVTLTEEFTDRYYGSADLDYASPHDWTVTVTGAEGFSFTESGTTTPCTPGDVDAVYLDAECDYVQYSAHGDKFPEGAVVTLTVDSADTVSEVIAAGGGPADGVSGYHRIDQQITHDVTLAVDSPDDGKDWSVSTTTTACPTTGTVVYPASPASVTACDATSDDVVLPADTEAITYSRATDGILATLSSGYSWGGNIDVPDWGWRELGPTTAVYRYDTAVRPRCDLTVVEFSPVCVDGEAYFDYAVATPDGSEVYGLIIEWNGMGAGFTQPSSGRYPWFSGEFDEDTYLAFVADGPNGPNSRYYAEITDFPTVDPCGTEGKVRPAHPHHPLYPGHPVHEWHPGDGSGLTKHVA